MLGASELKPRSWWTNDLSLVRLCVDLIHILAVWLTEARCPHYFINNCNLVDNSFNLEMIAFAGRLMSVSKSWLSSWFVNNYIRKCSQLCPHNVLANPADNVFVNATVRMLLLCCVFTTVNELLVSTYQ